MQNSSTLILPPPFRYAGGKRRLLPRLLDGLPSDVDAYIEPFLGSGTLLLQLLGRGFSLYIAGDRNPDLMAFWWALQADPQLLCSVIRRYELAWATADRKLLYQKVRSAEFQDMTHRAARFYFLMKTCFNGLWRVNSRGEMNTPIGDVKNPDLSCSDFDKLAQVMEDAILVHGEWDDIVFRWLSATRKALFYFDPPYIPMSLTSAFTTYTKNDFGIPQQEDLAHVADILRRKGHYVMVSNSCTPLTRELYRGWSVEEVLPTRSIAAKAGARGTTKELIIRSW